VRIYQALTAVANNIVAVTGPEWDVTAAADSLPPELRRFMDVPWKLYQP
jgi:hypothetical protein